MTRVFWDTMLFIYLLQGDARFAERVAYLRRRSIERGDLLCTSALAVGEVVAGLYRDYPENEAAQFPQTLVAAGFEILSFGDAEVEMFGKLRSKYRTSAADTIHLATGASFGVDLFLTNDEKLKKIHVPGIKFIAGLDADLF